MTTRAAELATRVREPWPGIEDGYDIAIDGAVGYAVRLLPSGRRLATYPTCRRALERVLEEIDVRGRHERTLAVDAIFPGDRTELLGGGRRLRRTAEGAVGRRSDQHGGPRRANGLRITGPRMLPEEA